MQTFLNFFTSIGAQALFTICLGALLVCAWQFSAWTTARNKPTEEQRFWRMTYRNIATALFIFGLMFIWRDGLQSVLLALGAAAAGFLIAFREAWLSFLGFWSRLIRRQYDVNDFVSVDGIQGRVMDITWFNTVIAETSPTDSLQYTGRVVHVPNNRMLISSLTTENLTGRYNAHTFNIPLPKGTSYKNALHYEQLLATSAHKHCSNFFAVAEAHMLKVRKDKALDTPSVKPKIRFVFEKDGAITLSARIVTPLLDKSRVEQAIVRDFLKLAAKQIEAEPGPAEKSEEQPN